MVSRFLAPICFGFAVGDVYGEGRFTVAAAAGVLGLLASIATSSIAMRRAMPDLARLAEEQRAAEAVESK